MTASWWRLERLMLAICLNRANDVFLLCLFKKRCLETAGGYMFMQTSSLASAANAGKVVS